MSTDDPYDDLDLTFTAYNSGGPNKLMAQVTANGVYWAGLATDLDKLCLWWLEHRGKIPEGFAQWLEERASSPAPTAADPAPSPPPRSTRTKTAPYRPE